MAYKKGQTKKRVNPNVYYVACYVDKTTYEALRAHISADINTSTVIRGALKDFLFTNKTLPRGTHKKEM